MGVRRSGVLLLGAILLGCLYHLEEHAQFLRLRTIEMQPSERFPATAIWEGLPPEVERFGLLFGFVSHSLAEKLSARFPIRCTFSGRWSLHPVCTMEPHRPIIAIQYKEKSWYLGTEGHLWAMEHPWNALIDTEDADSIPVLHWEIERQLPIETISRDQVYMSRFAAKRVNRYMQTLQELHWLQSMQSWTLSRKTGEAVVRITLPLEGNRVTVILKDVPQSWEQTARAIDSIVRRIEAEEGKFLLDATYKDRIVLRQLYE
ncbi:MAG: hypothetical protein K9L28_00490 [Synergistales bacterium]|nr:hypothetical protein [Synergistales bacterium]